MKPAVAKAAEPNPLADLGKATLEIVHDLKNQLNGLKLYATFLRKRLESNDRSEEERETIAKLIAGIERAAAEITVLVRYAHPVELRRRSHVNLQELIHNFSARFANGGARNNRAEPLYGDFDPEALTEAFRAVTEQALLKSSPAKAHQSSVSLRRATPKSSEALIEWHGVKSEYHSKTIPSLDGKLTVRLALATRIIEAHGGRVEHTEEVFRVWLPLSK